MRDLNSLRSILRWIQKSLPPSLEHEAETLLLAAYFKKTGRFFRRTELFFGGDSDSVTEVVSSDDSRNWLEWAIQQRSSGRPLQYITGFQFFLDHWYEVSPAVLIPRPETESLVRKTSEILSKAWQKPESSQKLGMEIGLGSGAISIELLSQFPELKMVASEISLEASAIGLKNASRILNSSDRLNLVQAIHSLDVLEPMKGLNLAFDFLISNPPYLESEAEMDSDVFQFEPHLALFAPKGDSLYFYRKIAEGAGSYLKSDGWVFLEIPHERSKRILSLFLEQTLGWDAKILQDLTGRDRILVAQRITKDQKE